VRFEQVEAGKVWRERAPPYPKCYWIVKKERGVFLAFYGSAVENAVVLHNNKWQSIHTSFIAAAKIASDHAAAGGQPR